MSPGQIFLFLLSPIFIETFQGAVENWPGKFHQMLSQLHVHYLAPVSQLKLQNHFTFVWV